jgi:hypothetical protein
MRKYQLRLNFKIQHRSGCKLWEELKSVLFVHGMILYLESLLELVKEFSNVAGYKIIIQTFYT